MIFQHGDVRYNTGETAELFCDYALSSGKDLPVTITWKAGWFPYEYPIFRCKGYTKASEKCTSMEWLDDDYFYRTGLATESPSLIISSVSEKKVLKTVFNIVYVTVIAFIFSGLRL